MKIILFNTLGREKQEFIPLEKGKAKIYSCGPTVYDNPTIGNYRAFWFADLLRNTFKFFGYKVKHVMNITDVGHLTDDADQGEDKLEKGAKRENSTARDIARKYENIFKKELQELNIELFDVMPKATEHIQQQIEIVKELEKKGYTYEIPGDGIYMDTSKIPDYGKLMGEKHLEGIIANARVENDRKKNPTDFALRKFSPKDKKRQMEWDSPRGKGFPGWHIECSAMSSTYLGKQFDIHTGGTDHIPVHHTNEIAQSECAFETHPWVKYRLHVEFLTVNGGKMGKSLGNAFTLTDIKNKNFSPLDLRFFYFTGYYRKFLDFTRESLTSAKNSKEKLHNKILFFTEKLSFDKEYGEKINKLLLDFLSHNLDKHWENSSKIIQYFKNFSNKKGIEINIKDGFFDMFFQLTDDFNTPKFLSKFFEAVDSIETLDELAVIYSVEKNILKLNLFEKTEIKIPEDIQELAEERRNAKKEKNYKLADKLREEIKQKGYKVIDTKNGYKIEKIN